VDVTTEEADRFLAACSVLGDHELERRLLHSEVTDVEMFRSSTADTYEFHFADGSRGAFKSIEGAGKNAAAFQHTAASVVLNDVSAWLVARALGYDHLIQGVVIVTCSAADVSLGTLQHWFPGEPGGPGWEDASQLRHAALLDALIGHQDRNATNFSYDGDADELGLYDNSFSFALPGHQTSASEILRVAHGRDPALGDDLAAALDRFDGSMERDALSRILPPERWGRVLERATMMRERGELLAPLDF